MKFTAFTPCSIVEINTVGVNIAKQISGNDLAIVTFSVYLCISKKHAEGEAFFRFTGGTWAQSGPLTGKADSLLRNNGIMESAVGIEFLGVNAIHEVVHGEDYILAQRNAAA